MQEKVPFEYEGLGLRFPFKTYTFQLGPYLISRRNMLLFKNYGIEKVGDAAFSFNKYVGIGDGELITDKIEHFWGQGSGGFHISIKLPGATYLSTCKDEGKADKIRQIKYTSRLNNIMIGEFALNSDCFEWVRGWYSKNQEEHSWFLGICLLKLNEISDSETAESG